MRSLLLRVLAFPLACGAAWTQEVTSVAGSQTAAEGHLLAAQEAQRGGNFVRAEREYRTAIGLVPGFPELHMNLGLVYQMEGRTTEAMAELRRALELKPGLEGANLMLGIDLCRAGEGNEAVPLLSAAVAQDPKRVEAYPWLATAQEISGDLRGELRTIQKGLSLAPGSVDLWYLDGHAYELLGQVEAVRMNAAAPDASFSERLLGESYGTSSDWTSAVLHFENAIAAAPQQPELHVERGEVLLRAGKLDGAIRDFEEELRIDSTSVQALVRRGEAELLRGHLESALSAWSRAIEIDPVYVDYLVGSHSGAGSASAADGLPASAIAAMDDLVPPLLKIESRASRLALAYIGKQHRSSADFVEGSVREVPKRARSAPAVCTEIGVRRALEAGRLSEASLCGRQILRKGSRQELRLGIAAALLRLGEYAEALDVLDGLGEGASAPAEVAYLRARCFEEMSTEAYLRLYRVDPNSFRVHQLMGDLAAAREDDKAAIAEFRAAIALKPTAPNLHYSLGHVLWKNSDIPGARAEFAAELALTPTHAGAFHDMGETYLMEHQSEKALAYLKQAVGAGGHGPDLDRDLGTAYAQLGQYGNAAMEYNLALASDRDGSIHFKLARVYRALGELEKASRESAIAADLSRKYHARAEKETPRREAVDD